MSRVGADRPDTIRDVRRLIVVSHVTHYRYANRLWAYGPYAREIELWANLLPEVVIAAPCLDEAPPADALPIAGRTGGNVGIIPQPLVVGGDRLRDKLGAICQVPRMVWHLWRAMRRGDAVQVRCPGNLGLLGALLARLASSRRICKYAGQWSNRRGEPLTWRLQKWLLRSGWWNAPVLAYGDWPGQPRHVVPFFSAALSDAQMGAARTACDARDADRDAAPRTVLFVGRLTANKNVDLAIRALAACRRDGVPLELLVVGDGPELPHLKAVAAEVHSGSDPAVTFVGAVPFEQVLAHYACSQILVLVSDTEGWPKAITEAMAFGLVPIGSDCGNVPAIIGDSRGLVVPPRDEAALAAALRLLATDATRWRAMSRAAGEWARQFSVEAMQRGIDRELQRWWRSGNQSMPAWLPPPNPARRAGGVSPRRGTSGSDPGSADESARANLEDETGKLAPTLSQSPRSPGRVSPLVGVLTLIDSLATGGAENVAVALTNGLDRTAFQPHICATRHGGPLEAQIADDVGRLILHRRHTLDLRGLKRLVRYIRAHDIRLLHAHSSTLLLASLASLFAPHPKVVWHSHLAWPTRGVTARVWHSLIRRAHGAIVVNPDLGRTIRDVVRRRDQRVWYLANTPASLLADAAPAADLPGDAAAPTIVCVANLRPQKNHPLLIRAMRRVVDELPAARLLLAGGFSDAAWRDTVLTTIGEQKLTGHVFWLGERSDVPAVLAASQIGVLSSDDEGLPLALLEYGAAGLASVATAVGDCPVVLDQGRAGRLVPPGDEAALAGALVDLLCNEAERQVLGEQLKQRVSARHDPAAVQRRLAAIYRIVLGT